MCVPYGTAYATCSTQFGYCRAHHIRRKIMLSHMPPVRAVDCQTQPPLVARGNSACAGTTASRPTPRHAQLQPARRQPAPRNARPAPAHTRHPDPLTRRVPDCHGPSVIGGARARVIDSQTLSPGTRRPTSDWTSRASGRSHAQAVRERPDWAEASTAERAVRADTRDSRRRQACGIKLRSTGHG